MPSPLLALRSLGAVLLAILLPGAAADYARAERTLGHLTQPLLDHAVERVDWLDATHFAYVDRRPLHADGRG